MQPPIRQATASLRERWAATLGASSMARSLFVSGAAGVFMAMVGAFGSGVAPLPLRLAYWIGLMAGGAALGVGLSRWARRRGWFGGVTWRQSLAVSALVAAPMSLLVWAANGLLFASPLTLWSWLSFLAPVLIVSAAVTAVNYLADHRASAPPPVPLEVAPAPVKFLERLPAKLAGAELYAVEAEDHYLRLHTSKGQDLVLMRLADAVDELEGLGGARTHRSWWVARQAVAEVRRSDGRAVLVLRSGVEAPVSRSYAPGLREAGWF